MKNAGLEAIAAALTVLASSLSTTAPQLIKPDEFAKKHNVPKEFIHALVNTGCVRCPTSDRSRFVRTNRMLEIKPEDVEKAIRTVRKTGKINWESKQTETQMTALMDKGAQPLPVVLAGVAGVKEVLLVAGEQLVAEAKGETSETPLLDKALNQAGTLPTALIMDDPNSPQNAAQRRADESWKEVSASAAGQTDLDTQFGELMTSLGVVKVGAKDGDVVVDNRTHPDDQTLALKELIEGTGSIDLSKMNDTDQKAAQQKADSIYQGMNEMAIGYELVNVPASDQPACIESCKADTCPKIQPPKVYTLHPGYLPRATQVADRIVGEILSYADDNVEMQMGLLTLIGERLREKQLDQDDKLFEQSRKLEQQLKDVRHKKQAFESVLGR